MLRLAFVLGATRGRMGSGFGGFDFSHEGVKRVVGLLKGFVHAIVASAPHEILYLSYLEINEHII